jgi:hypothetical protein
MLPLAFPLFVVPRIVSAHLEHRLSGRALLVLGALLVATGLLFTAMCIMHFDYTEVVVPMFIAWLGAGMLNGQVAKVGMTVVPVERAGMASGISGTMRFSGIVVGLAALGAILFQTIASNLSHALPGIDPQTRVEITRLIANGNLEGAARAIVSHGAAAEIALQSLGHGYVSLMLAASIVAFAAAAISWILIDPSETAAMSKSSPSPLAEFSIDWGHSAYIGCHESKPRM